MLRSLLNPEYESVSTGELVLEDGEKIKLGTSTVFDLVANSGKFDILDANDDVFLRVEDGGSVVIGSSADEMTCNAKINIRSNPLKALARAEYNLQDVRNISSPSQGYVAYHDGSGTNTEGLAAHNGTDWISQVDGSTIS